MTAPTPDEAAALADAETYTRAMAERRKHHGALAAFVAEYDRRAAEIAALRAEVERARTREQAVRALHGVKVTVPGDDDFAQCLHCAGDWPCATLRALDATTPALGPVETPQEETRG
jgi:hypothetical protein